ncbi:MAG TPA: hypothetical protein VKT00_01195 [Casimicrobiaceae bacterium]|nr:hypothetical protein [Casimicrobiaceae bacterium]
MYDVFDGGSEGALTLRERWRRRLRVKGILHPEDALRAAEIDPRIIARSRAFIARATTRAPQARFGRAPLAVGRPTSHS